MDMNKNPLVSTITPCFNMKKYLRVFLEQLPLQTYFDNIEVVLDHNEPTQEEIDWVKEFQQKFPNKIKHIIVEKVDPIGKSMNRCIDEASGEYLTIWNVDDLRTPQSIELQAKALQEKSVDLVYGNYKVVSSFTKKEGAWVEHKNIPLSELTRSMIIGPFFMFKKSLCQSAGYFDEQLTSGADFDLAIRLALHAKTYCIEECLGYYLNEGLGASTRPNSKQPLDRTIIELRYGIYDKINYDYLPNALTYNINNILAHNTYHPVSLFVPQYNDFMAERKNKWFFIGLQAHVTKLSKAQSRLRRYAKIFKQPLKKFYSSLQGSM